MSSQVDDRPKTNGHVPADPSLRTFRGRSLEEVLPQIRAELGPDAVVVRQREGLMGGIGGFFQQQFVEVQARPGAQRIDLYDEEPASPAPPAPFAPPAAAQPAPPAPAPAADPVEPAAPPRLSAAELLRQATGAGAGDTRTPAEILREHSDTFARQLAAAEERAEPVVSARAQTAPEAAEAPTAPEAAAPAAPAEEPAIPQRRAYAAPRPAAEEPIPLPQRPAPAPAPEPDLPPAAEAPAAAPAAAAQAPVAEPTASAAAARAPARRASKRRAAARARARAARARAARARAARARAARAVRAPAARAPAARAPAKAKAPAQADTAPAPAFDDPEPIDGGVGPQTTHALELAAAIAASVGAPRPAAIEPAAPARDDDAALPAAPAATKPALPAPAPAVLPSVSAPRRSLFGRRARRGPTTPRVVAGGPEAALVAEQLGTRGLAPAATDELLLDATAHVLPFTPGADVRTAVRNALARRIPTLPPARIGGRAVAFVGAGGGGKTRSTAGLAAAYAQGSTLPVACLTLAPADGGAELTALLKPHGVNVEVVETPEKAAERLTALRAEAVVVLDTPAVSPVDGGSVEALGALLAGLQLDEIQLVVPATLSAAVAQELVERLGPLQPTGITMTHADATDHIGAVVELACATRLPLSYVNSGLELPGALAPADPVAIAERLLP
jgi:flagellar biosynthesis GTPase FlhF